MHLKDGRLLPGVFGSGIDDGVTRTTTNVSAAIEESNPIVKVEFTRLRYRLERYEKLPTRLDLKPEDPKPQPAAPAVPGFRRL